MALCQQYANLLKAPIGIDSAQLLWAIAGKETSFGRRCIPRHENSYCYGSKNYRADKMLRDLTETYGCVAHCSYGPWQIMFYNAYSLNRNLDPIILMTDAAACADITTMMMNVIFSRQQPNNVRDFADAWNSGSMKDDFQPIAYMDAVEQFYKSNQRTDA